MFRAHCLWLALLALLLPLAACGATGSRGGGKFDVRLQDYDKSQSFGLASESHTDRVEYYSQKRRDAELKIQSDEVMNALVNELDKQGYDDYAQEGRAPSGGHDRLTWSIQVEQNGKPSFWAVGSGTEADERIAFQGCVQTFLQIYNVSASWQVIENEQGRAFFDNAQTKQLGR